MNIYTDLWSDATTGFMTGVILSMPCAQIVCSPVQVNDN